MRRLVTFHTIFLKLLKKLPKRYASVTCSQLSRVTMRTLKRGKGILQSTIGSTLINLTAPNLPPGIQVTWYLALFVVAIIVIAGISINYLHPERPE